MKKIQCKLFKLKKSVTTSFSLLGRAQGAPVWSFSALQKFTLYLLHVTLHIDAEQYALLLILLLLYIRRQILVSHSCIACALKYVLTFSRYIYINICSRRYRIIPILKWIWCHAVIAVHEEPWYWNQYYKKLYSNERRNKEGGGGQYVVYMAGSLKVYYYTQQYEI